MVKIIADAAADLTKEEAARLDITVIPFVIMLGEDQVIADENLKPRDFYKMLNEADVIPKTAQKSPADIEDAYRKIGNENEIIYITISAKGSGINNTASFVAEQLKEEGYDITIIDSAMYSHTIGKTVIKAAEMAKDGKSKQEIIDYATEVYARDTAYFVVDDLTFLHKSGRIKATSMAISKVLDIKPVLKINDGLVEAFQKIRGLKKAMTKLVDFIDERMDSPEDNTVLILQNDAQDKVDIIEEMIRERINPKAIEHVDIGPVITSHVGTGVVGVYFKHKKPYTEYKD